MPIVLVKVAYYNIMLVAVLVFCPNYAQIMLAFQNYATFLKNYSVHKLHNSQDKFENVFY